MKLNVKPERSVQDKKSVSAVFILTFNSLLITAIATANSGVGYGILAIALFFFQTILTKKFVESQYLMD